MAERLRRRAERSPVHNRRGVIWKRALIRREFGTIVSSRNFQCAKPTKSKRSAKIA